MQSNFLPASSFGPWHNAMECNRLLDRQLHGDRKPGCFVPSHMAGTQIIVERMSQFKVFTVWFQPYSGLPFISDDPLTSPWIDLVFLCFWLGRSFHLQYCVCFLCLSESLKFFKTQDKCTSISLIKWLSQSLNSCGKGDKDANRLQTDLEFPLCHFLAGWP